MSGVEVEFPYKFLFEFQEFHRNLQGIGEVHHTCKMCQLQNLSHLCICLCRLCVDLKLKCDCVQEISQPRSPHRLCSRLLPKILPTGNPSCNLATMVHLTFSGICRWVIAMSCTWLTQIYCRLTNFCTSSMYVVHHSSNLATCCVFKRLPFPLGSNFPALLQ